MARFERATDSYYNIRYVKYHCGYHFVWVPRYRGNVLVGSVAKKLEEL
ncbi:transposase [Stygiolobus azoricus]|uniref:Transposase IS200-like domain-containing protein n=1 Tax=Stygiolobus azoricus TaxID=41675 RepID=A0A650CMA4_9CREN|nr:transposase [Stygiolobus azoricus]QGR18888.1 hypothetical protein D1868_02065 [Stygiolobus azoricus]